MFLSAGFYSACNKEDNPPQIHYPFTYEYNQLAFSPTLWFVLTTNAATEISQPASATGFETELKSILESPDAIPYFQRLTFLSDSTVQVTFFDSGITFDTIFPYQVESGKTLIQTGPGAFGVLVFNEGTEANSLVFGVISTIFSSTLPNGQVDYSPIEIRYDDVLDPVLVANELRIANGLEAGDTVGVNIGGYLFK